MSKESIPRWWSKIALRGQESLKLCAEKGWEKMKGCFRRRKDKLISPEQFLEEEDKLIYEYIADLLPYEIRYAAVKYPELDNLDCDVLALLVGHSFEPLLLAISVFEPDRVLLLLNAMYGEELGQERGKRLKRFVEDTERGLARWLGHAPAVELCAIDCRPHLADRPESIFRALCDYALPHQRDGRRVVVDITGGKKSMDAGAFLFAAYADIPISYVDFDDYNPEYRLPPGYSCHVGKLNNPYEAFRLHEWEQVRQDYEQYRFRAAASSVFKIWQVMRKPVELMRNQEPALLFQPEQIEAVKKLFQVLTLYARWDDGDYSKAKKHCLPGLERGISGFAPPAAVRLLGNDWPPLSASRNAIKSFDSKLFKSNRLLLGYARDELAKIWRLAKFNEDYRSALLRAIGLDELLLKARWVRLWDSAQVKVWAVVKEGNREREIEITLNASLERELRLKLLDHEGEAGYMRQALQMEWTQRGPDPPFLPLKTDKPYRARLLPVRSVRTLAHYEGRSDTRELSTLRNQAIHKYRYITQSDAEAAIRLAEANLQDFEDHWTDLVQGSQDSIEGRDKDPGRLSWKQLCDLCGVNFLPLTKIKEAA